MSDSSQPYYALHSANSSLVLDCRGNAPVILYWGTRLSESTEPAMLGLLATRQEAPASADDEAPVALSPERGAGFSGNAGIQVHRNGRHWGVFSRIESVEQEGESAITVVSRCDATSLRITHQLTLDQTSDVLAATTEITNLADEPLQVDYCAAPSIPLPPQYDQILGFHGRWAKEFQLQGVQRFTGAYLRENRAGRTSHGSFPGVVLHTAHTSEGAGEAYGLHLGWSGNHRVMVEELPDGRAYAQLGELFHPGELSLEPGGTYRSPVLYGVYTSDGFSALSRCFHRHVRSRLTDPRTRAKPRPVHFNTWEAMYFDLSMDKLTALAEEAAAVGVERFVLDDGWFRNRHSDQAGLGDWYVDDTKFPEGLGPLIDRVHEFGMEFGLWIEPEMVNPDSDLYRAHPDWVLSADPAPRVMARNQLVLDLTRAEVCDYLFERIDALLTEYEIAYLKWDMNRDLHQPGDASGRAAVHRQTRAVYALLARVRAAHPSVEIESCASGGGRADFGILAHTDRIWTSDSNDALDRLAIQRGFSFFFPPEIMGSHVGPARCHITGCVISMTMRAGVALFGAMGVEANLLEVDAADRAELAAAIALHKQHRALLHGGDLQRLETADFESAFAVVAEERDEALVSYALLNGQPHAAPGRLRLRGLDRDGRYRVSVIWPQATSRALAPILAQLDGALISGDALMSAGLQLPIMQPQSLFILHLQRG